MASNPGWDADQLRRAAVAVRNLIKDSADAGEWADWVPPELERVAGEIERRADP